MQLTHNFSLKEIVNSPTAVRLDFEEQFDSNPEIIENLRQLCIHILQPLRESARRAVFVNSGYRCLRLNSQVNGSRLSQHLKGQAADLVVSGYSIEQIYNKIRNSNLPYDQVIQEFDRWIHISFNSGPGGFRKQNLRAVKENGMTKYLQD